MDVAEEIRAVELRRTRALVDRDLKTAREIIADDFELIPPPGGALTKDGYLAGFENGTFGYERWDYDSPIAVRVHGEAAIIRYLARLETVVNGKTMPMASLWFTNLYERRDGSWRLVWSQGTRNT